VTAARFERAVARSAADRGATLAIESHHATAWHSATFAGDRHELVVHAAPGAALEAWAADLGALDLALPGRLLADLRVAARERRGDRVTLRLVGVTVACDVSSARGYGAACARG
jgi:hypothetical protein